MFPRYERAERERIRHTGERLAGRLGNAIQKILGVLELFGLGSAGRKDEPRVRILGHIRVRLLNLTP